MGSDSVLSNDWLYSGLESRDIETRQKSYGAVNKYFSNPIVKYLTVKGKTLEIGGDNCHLCGADKKYVSSHWVMGKKGKSSYSVSKTYRCGSRYHSFMKYDNETRGKEKKKFFVGKNCIRMEEK